ncbi:MAG: hypothetical protein AMK69_24970 [Nitrospira bacterium SG8_3]|jgi:hypothetical protein|nr:MAG: hypothetical protein AMK69_24970 [Nitrospira bacterium SG8_3]
MVPKMNPSKTRMARLVKAKDKDRSFDLLFWKRVGAEGRFAAAWQMVSEVNAIKGKDIGESRLQRSVENVKRIRSRGKPYDQMER